MNPVPGTLWPHNVNTVLPCQSPRAGPDFNGVAGWRRLCACLALLCASPAPLLALDPAKSIYQYNVRSWTRHEGLPSDKINSIVQTRDGYIWLGTQRGLVRFDGIDFREVALDFAEAGGSEVARLAPSDTGLWIAINQSAFAHYAKGSFTPLGGDAWPKNSQNAKAILQTHDGSIWAGSNLGLGRWVPERPRESFWSDAVLNIRALCEAPSGGIWIGTEDGGVISFHAGRFTPLDDPTLKQEVIMALAAGPEGELWVATGKGLRCYEADGRRREITLPPGIAGTMLALLFDRQGTLWIGTSGRGLLRHRDGVFAVLRKTEGLGSDFVTSLFEDLEGSLWVGTRDGLSQLTDIRFPIFSALEGMSDGTGHTVSASRRGGVWLTTSSGYAYFDGQQGHRFTGPALPANRYIKLGFEARNGDFYLVDGDRTLHVVADGAIVASHRNDVWPEAIAEDPEGIVLALGPGLFRLRDGRMVPYAFRGPAPNFGYFDSLMVARDGAIWAATYLGIFRIEDGEYRSWGMAQGLSGERVHFLFEDEDGAIWAGMPTGLARLKEGAVRNLTVAHGLPANRIFAIVSDQFGYFWLTTSRGIVRVSRRQLNDAADGMLARMDCELFDGLESVKFSDRTEQGYSGCRTADGRIWFPNPQGMVMIDPAAFFKNTVPPPVDIQQVRIDGRDAVESRDGVLQLAGRRLEFSFAALSFIAPKKILLRYRLEGYDAGWIEAGPRRSALYNNLPPGRYTFRVQAQNADGVWNADGASVRVALPPKFYQTGWFYAACSIVVVFGLLGIHRTRVRLLEKQQKKLRAENDLLEAKVSERTDELASLVSLLKATIESTADGILALHFSGDIVSFNNQFASMWGLDPQNLSSRRDADVLATLAMQVNDPVQFLARLKDLRSNPEIDAFDVLQLNDGRTIERYVKPQRIAGKCVGIVINFRDVTARKLAEAQLERVNKQLFDASRHAGMAEIATNVLHNVGNVLNSVNVSATLVSDRVHELKFPKLRKLAELLREPGEDLAAFLAHDARGRKIPDYLELLAREFESRQTAIAEEVAQIRGNVEHIKEIVARQQSYARVSGVVEKVPVADLIEEALQGRGNSFAPQGIELVRDYRATPAIAVDRHKVVQILDNLLQNAEAACQQSPQANKQVKVAIEQSNGHVSIAVTDNGVGIAPENLTRIFQHGFTTRSHGHGYGLHSGALAARELGGSLAAHSPGLGHGATFTLELPVQN